MKTYDNPLTISYSLGSHDFGAGAGAHAIQRPKGVSRARIEEIHVAVSETFNQVTTPAYVRIGTAADADKFAELNMAAAAITDGYGTNDDQDAVKAAGLAIDLDRGGDAGAALDQLEVTFVAPTGGTPAGIGEVTVVISWY
jgi:hypothetical protein